MKEIGIPIDADRLMTPEKALRWLLEFGSDWVECKDLTNSWADKGLMWHEAVSEGYLEDSTEYADGSSFGNLELKRLKLTPKAIKLIGETKCTEANR